MFYLQIGLTFTIWVLYNLLLWSNLKLFRFSNMSFSYALHSVVPLLCQAYGSILPQTTAVLDGSQGLAAASRIETHICRVVLKIRIKGLAMLKLCCVLMSPRISLIAWCTPFLVLSPTVQHMLMCQHMHRLCTYNTCIEYSIHTYIVSEVSVALLM